MRGKRRFWPLLLKMSVPRWIVSTLCIGAIAVDGTLISGPRVETTYGVLRGYTLESRSNKRTIFSFSGVPYAKPPVGQLRFEDPKAPDRWAGERLAKDVGVPCVQFIALIPLLNLLNVGREDCLYLSIYTTDFNARNPVIVYFHGGAYSLGFGELTHGPEYLLDEDLVVVTVNYRLGLFGFLSFENEILSGNYGMKDQVMALKWVRDNAEYFGGDSNRVTVMGESAGGASTDLVVRSPLSAGLVHRVISESGSALTPWAVSPPGEGKEMSLRVAETVGCDTRSSSEDIARCLRKKRAVDLINAQRIFAVWQIDPLVQFKPVIDPYSKSPFLPEDPWHLAPPAIPWLTGLMTFEGAVRIPTMTTDPNSYKRLSRDYVTLLPVALCFNRTACFPERVSRRIWRFYHGNKTQLDESDSQNISNMYGDGLVLSGLKPSLMQHSGDKYVYLFDYVGSQTYMDIFGAKRTLRGPGHGDETIYLWYNPDFFSDVTGPDRSISEVLVKLWSNFAATGNPTPDGFWKKWDAQYESYLNISNAGLAIQTGGLFKGRSDFWLNLPYRDKIISQGDCEKWL